MAYQDPLEGHLSLRRENHWKPWNTLRLNQVVGHLWREQSVTGLDDWLLVHQPESDGDAASLVDWAWLLARLEVAAAQDPSFPRPTGLHAVLWDEGELNTSPEVLAESSQAIAWPQLMTGNDASTFSSRAEWFGVKNGGAAWRLSASG
jgi:hypothetical protein